MWTLVTLLCFTAIVIPYTLMNYDEPLTPHQWEVLQIMLQLAAGKACLVFVVNIITGNYSQVDKLWSLVPALYVWVAVWFGGMNERQFLMGTVVSVWSARLTYNFARKGGYSWRFWEGEEDYRWAELRKNPVFAHPVMWFIFNLTFISVYQSFLICSFTFPIVLSVNPEQPLNWLDAVAALLVLSFVVLEYFAD